MIGAAPLGGLGGNGGRLECVSGQIGSESSRFLSCMYSSIKLSNFVSTSSTCNKKRCVRFAGQAVRWFDDGCSTQCWIAASIKFYGQSSPKHATAPYSLVFQF